MNWHNLSDSDFDKGLRDHLKDPGIPYDPVSWIKMKKILDAHFPSDNGIGGPISLLTLAALLSAVFFWNLISFSETGYELKAMQQQVEMDRNQIDPDQQQETNQIQLKQNDQKHDEEEYEDGQSLATVVSRDQGSNPLSDAGTQSEASAFGNLNQDGNLMLLNGNHAAINQELTITLPEHLETLELSLEQDPPVIDPVGKSPWFIGIGYAPDFSLVGSGDATSPGTNLGIAIEYRLGTRWGIQTGLTYSMKKYKAAGEDYNPPSGFWYYGRVPDNTDGECNVIDIPINVRYYFKPDSKHRFFASTGISSYLMLTEDYYYQYDGYPNPNLVDSWSVKNENQHYFGVYNLSVGYQRSLGTSWSLEIEPFIKLPLSGVGFGRVDLWSTGSTFSLKYNFK